MKRGIFVSKTWKGALLTSHVRSMRFRQIQILLIAVAFSIFLVSFTFSNSTSPWSLGKVEEGIAHAVYINLEHRIDRRVEIETELRAARIPLNRVNASDGASWASLSTTCPYSKPSKCAAVLGCKLSHIDALDLALRENWQHVAVFEDDFAWAKGINPSTVQNLIWILENKLETWDLLAISLNIRQSEPVKLSIDLRDSEINYEVVRILDAKATHGYLVNRHYMRTLKSNIQACAKIHIQIDNCWRTLQKSALWYGLSPQLGTQRPGFSDIEKEVVNYSYIQ